MSTAWAAAKRSQKILLYVGAGWGRGQEGALFSDQHPPSHPPHAPVFLGGGGVEGVDGESHSALMQVLHFSLCSSIFDGAALSDIV